MQNIVRFVDVKKRYKKKDALKGLSFDVQAGELLALLGPNGAGKSTSMSLIQGLRHADSGLVEVFADSPRTMKVRNRIGATPQELSFPNLLTVAELIKFASCHYQRARELKDLSEILSLGKILHRRAGGLSGGEKRRLGLALALVGNPELLLLDEPTTGMDVEARRDLWKIIENLVKEGRTIILTTHYLEEVEALAKRVIVIDQGTSLFDGTVDQIKAKVDLKKVHFCSASHEGLAKLPGVVQLESKGSEATILTFDSDKMICQLVENKINFHQLTVELASLEEAFLQIRGCQK